MWPTWALGSVLRPRSIPAADGGTGCKRRLSCPVECKSVVCRPCCTAGHVTARRTEHDLSLMRLGPLRLAQSRHDSRRSVCGTAWNTAEPRETGSIFGRVGRGSQVFFQRFLCTRLRVPPASARLPAPTRRTHLPAGIAVPGLRSRPRSVLRRYLCPPLGVPLPQRPRSKCTPLRAGPLGTGTSPAWDSGISAASTTPGVQSAASTASGNWKLLYCCLDFVFVFLQHLL